VIDHLAGHAPVDADVLACDESCLVGTQVEHHAGNVHRIAYTTRWLLNGIGAVIEGAGSIYPTGRDAVHTNLARQTDRQGMRQSGNTTLCCRIALRLRLTHTVAR